MGNPLAQWQTTGLPNPSVFMRVKYVGDPVYYTQGASAITLGEAQTDDTEYPDVWIHSPNSQVIESVDLAHNPIPYCYLKVWVKETVERDWVAISDNFLYGDYVGEITESEDSYTFPPVVGLNIIDYTEGVTADENLHIDSSTTTVHTYSNPETPPPELDTTEAYRITVKEKYTVEILKYSLVSGYEPDIDTDPGNPQPNGYPDPV